MAAHRLLAKLELPAPLHDFGSFLIYVARRFRRDRCLQVASSLGYTSLIGMVPFLAICFTVLAAFPAFDRVQAQVEDFVLANIAPHVEQQAVDYIKGFVANTGGMTTIGVIGLAVTALLLLATIENAFDTIWRVSERRRVFQRLLAYWAALTLGPLLLGGAFSVSTYLFAEVRMAGLDAELPDIGWHAKLTPFVLTAATFTLLYVVMPNTRVRWTHALAGAVFAAVLFELLKFGFRVFVDNVPTYRTLYGALASVPVFLIWMYLTWMVVLAGAVVAASWPEWHAERQGARGAARDARVRLWLSLMVLRELLLAARAGETRDRQELLRRLDADSADLKVVLEMLRNEHYVARGEYDVWFLTRELDSTTLFDLYRAIGQGAAAKGGVPGMLKDAAWAAPIGEMLGEVSGQLRSRLSTPLKTLLAPEGPEEEAEAAAKWPRPVQTR